MKRAKSPRFLCANDLIEKRRITKIIRFMKTTRFIQLLDSKTMYIGDELNEYAMVRGCDFNEFFEHSMTQTASKKVEGLLKISYNNNQIYRKFIGSNLVDPDCIILDNRSLAELGISRGEAEMTPPAVQIEPACAFAYLWHNSFSFIREPFQWAIIGMFISVLLGILSVVLSVYQLVHLC